MTGQTTPQTSPTSEPRMKNIERHVALALKLQMRKEALANMQERIFSTQMEILKLQDQTETKLEQQDSLGTSGREVDEVSESGSDWSTEDELSDEMRKLSC